MHWVKKLYHLFLRIKVEDFIERLMHRLIVGDGFVTIIKDEMIRSFFEHAEEAEAEDESNAMDRESNDLDGDVTHPQKHAESPELVRKFLLDAAAVIFEEQVEKAFREGTAWQNAQ
ncbi:uncharacterized protein C2845_PM14G00640 [Panicum miliaceum]|uniref:Uncharacterized protein n=1 Tax=Panicum miliaceum TaxID=4540 RepID=A0A3L6PRR3_PANMI|nr:uncharacterized protein C2845_PM14G00640 [Panicum miliaceum]